MGAALKRLADRTQFVSDGSLGDGGLTKAHTFRRSKKSKKASGLGSQTRFSSRFYRRLRSAHHERPADQALLLWLRFEFGLMLAHEVCHALVIQTEGDTGWEPYFHDGLVGEVGYEMELRLFGGKPDILFANETTGEEEGVRILRYTDGRDDDLSKLHGIPIVWRWPYRSIIDEYKKDKYYMTVRRADQIPDRDLAWRVPVDFFAKFFTDSFWQNDVPGDETNAFRAPKDLGYLFKAKSKGELQPMRPRNGDEPDGYRRDNHNGIVPA